MSCRQKDYRDVAVKTLMAPAQATSLESFHRRLLVTLWAQWVGLWVLIAGLLYTSQPWPGGGGRAFSVVVVTCPLYLTWWEYPDVCRWSSFQPRRTSNTTTPATKELILTIPCNSHWQKCSPVELLVFVSWWCDVCSNRLQDNHDTFMIHVKWGHVHNPVSKTQYKMQKTFFRPCSSPKYAIKESSGRKILRSKLNKLWRCRIFKGFNGNSGFL